MIMIGINGKNDSKIYQTTSNIIVLFDSTLDVQKLKDVIKKNPKLIIISFDYESHKTLLKSKINHTVSDNYLQESDLETIQNHSYKISEWFNGSEITNFLEYNGINLGKLYQVEFHYLLVPFLKKFVEFARIFNTHSSAKFLVPIALYDIVYSFTSNVTKLHDNKSSNEFLYDSIKIPMKIGNTPFQLSIPRQYYLKFKHITEKIIQLLLGSKNMSGKKSILLVEFDPIRYKKFLRLGLKTSLNFFFFNRRRPSIWNYESFQVIKSSRCQIITPHDIVNNELLNTIKKNIAQVDVRIESIINHNFFESFFSIYGYSFWKPIKQIFTDLTKKRIYDAIYEIELTKHMFEKNKISSVMVWSEIGFNEQIVINLAKKSNIPVVLIQHGLYYDTVKAYEFNKLAGIFPFYSDKFVVWGKTLEKYALDIGIPSEKIVTIGSTSFDELFDMRTNNSNFKEDFILLVTSSPTNNFASDLTVKTRERYENTVKKLCEVVLKLNKNLVIKLHPFSEELDVSKLVKEINPKITVLKTGDFSSLVRSCEVFITIDISTTILEAQILRKPVISISVKNYQFGKPEVFSSNSCIVTDIDNFESNLKHMIEDSNFKEKIIENGNRFVDNYLSNQGTACEKLLLFLENL